MPEPSIIIFGATGQQGLAQLAAARGRQVIAIGNQRVERRRQEYAGDSAAPEWMQIDLANQDAVARIFDYTDGADAKPFVLLNMPSSSFNPEAILLRQFDNILAAASGRIEKLIFNTSMFVPRTLSGFQALDVRRRMIDALAQTDLTYVVVKPVIYMDNLLTDWARPALMRDRVFRYPHHSDLEVSWISLTDVARIMLALTQTTGFDQTEITIGGPETLKGAQVAQNLSQALGQDIRFETMPIPEFAEIMAGLFSKRNGYDPTQLKRELMRVYEWYNTSDVHPFKVDMTRISSDLSLELTPMRKWLDGVKW